MARSLIPKANRPYPPIILLCPRHIITFEAVDLLGMCGCHRKLWENVMDVIVKIEQINTWERQRQRHRQTKTRM